MEKIEVTYSLVVEEHEGGYLAYFPALPGCHTWGKSYKDAVEYAEEALPAYLDALMAHGDEIPKETGAKKPVSLGITVRTPVIA
jgi:predicted RNase H-like HicB family nuclease